MLFKVLIVKDEIIQFVSNGKTDTQGVGTSCILNLQGRF